MKFLLTFLTVLALSYADSDSTPLRDDLLELWELIPIDELGEIAARYNAEDAEFQRVIAYLQGDEWHDLVDIVADHPTWQEFKAFMLERGVDVDAIVELLHNIKENARHSKNTKSQRTFRDFLDEVLALIDLDAILVKVDELLQRPSFLEFFEEITSEEFRAFVDDVRAEPEVQRVATELRALGVDVDRILEVFNDIFGWF